MKNIVAAAALAALFAWPVIAGHFDPMNYVIEHTSETPTHMTHRIHDGPCVDTPQQLIDHAVNTRVMHIGDIPTPMGMLIMFSAPDDSYGEGWLVGADSACLYLIAERKPV